MRHTVGLLVAYAITSFCHSFAASPGDDFNANTAAAVSTLQQWYNPNGLWDTTGWWNAANCVEAVENEIVANNDLNRLSILQQTFSRNSGGSFLNDYYDDEGWWAEAWIRAYDLTGNPSYLNMARTIFSDMTTGWDSHCGGGLWWSKSRTYKNAIPNELFLLVAIRLHQRTPGDGGPGSYYDWATNEWAWFKASGMINSQNLVNDGLTDNCVNNGQTTWTYNQGVILGGLTDLYKTTGDATCLSQAEAIADAAVSRLVSGSGVLQEPCEVQGGCGGGDVPQFKGIFVRNLACLYDVDHRSSYYNFLYANAHYIWLADRNGSGQFGLKWTGPFDSADAARQSSVIMPLSALAEPVTGLLPFAKGAGDPAFNHSVGTAAGTLAWKCSPAIAGHAGYMQSGPYLISVPTGSHAVHFRLAVDATSDSPSNLLSLIVAENGSVLNSHDVAWDSFAAANQSRDFRLPFTNRISGGMLEFRVYWNQATNAPVVTLSDVTLDGAQNWVAANLDHNIGRLDGLNAWEADPLRDHASGYLTKGPGTAELPPGSYKAQFELKVDNFNWDDANVATLSVVDSDSGAVLASRDVVRSEFTNAMYRSFPLYFHAIAGKRYDFRTFWDDSANAPRLTQRSVVVTPASGRSFTPMSLLPGSYNQDMIVERTAPHPPASDTTASMDAGTGNNANSWYERGYDTAAISTGLPPAGSIITNASSTDHVFRFAPSFSADDAAMVDSTHAANLVPSARQPFSALSFLTAAGHGPALVDYRVQHADGSAETGSFISPDWFFNAPVAFNAQGRVDVVSGAFNSVNNNNPRLYAEDITLTNLASPVANVQLNWDSSSSSGSVAAVFAISGVGLEPVQLAASVLNGRIVLKWSFGRLLESSTPAGPWTAIASAVSPYEVTPDETGRFFRVQVD